MVPHLQSALGIVVIIAIAWALSEDRKAFNWRMVAGPKGMTPAQIAYWDRVIGKLVQTPEWKKDLADNVFEGSYRNSAATELYMQADYEQFRAALAELGMLKK